MSAPRYSVLIEWSVEDECYIASFPEWADRAIAHTHGDTYEECARKAGEVLELLMDGETNPPAPHYFEYAASPTTDEAKGTADLRKRSA